MEWWKLSIPMVVLIAYVHVFNAIATLYLDSGRQMQVADLVRHLKM